MGNNFAMNDQSLARSFSVRDEDRDDFFHSSGYAGAQNEGRIGAASRGMTVEERQELSENRKFVRGYENASLAAQVASARERNISMFERGKGAENGGNGFSAGGNSAGGISGTGNPRDVSGAPRGVNEASGLSGRNAGGETGVAQGGYRYSDDRARRQEANNYKDYAAMAKQEMTQRGGNTGGNAGGNAGSYGGGYGGGYSGGRDSIYGGGAGGYGSGASSGRGFAPNFGGSVERNYGSGQSYGGGQNYGSGHNYGAGQGYGGGYNFGAGQSGGVGRTGQAGLNSAISNTQRFTNNFGMKFGPK